MIVGLTAGDNPMPERELDFDGYCQACKRVKGAFGSEEYPAALVSLVFEDDVVDGEEPPRRFVVVGNTVEVDRGTAIGVCLKAEFLDGTSDWLHNLKLEERKDAG